MHAMRTFWCIAMLMMVHLITGCCGPECQQLHERLNNLSDEPQFSGGGVDPLVSQLPFQEGYTSECVQGAGGSISHHATSTYYDIDLDTPNDRNDLVFAPVSGTAYVHDRDPEHNFGIHVNIDQGDGTYVILAHLASVFVANDTEVTAGELLGFEGSTGNSSGDHVHFGRHQGDASLDGIYGKSIDGLVVDAYDGDEHVELRTDEMTCALPGGTTYTSGLKTPLWHPNGSLVKTPWSPAIYRLEGDQLMPFWDEHAFASYNYDYNDVALISQAEYDCYYHDSTHLLMDTSIEAVYGAGANEGVWLLVGGEDEEEWVRYSLKVPDLGWQAVLKSWGINASTYDDLFHDTDVGGLVRNYRYGGVATFRDGSLVSPAGHSDVYVMSDGIAMPIETWDTLLLAGWQQRQVIEVADDEFDNVVTEKGDCRTNMHCLTSQDVLSCGGELNETQGINQSVSSNDELSLTWFTPDNRQVDSITLTGAVTHAGEGEKAWGSVFNEVLNANQINAVVQNMHPGDSLRFSVQYRDNGVPSWSCLAPYPPGTMQGTVVVEHNGDYLTAELADDPASDGCGLRVQVP